MTILDYNTFTDSISASFILRDNDNIPSGIKVRNQETKEIEDIPLGINFSYTLSDSTFNVVLSTLLSNITKNTTFSIEIYDSIKNPIYRDIVVFNERLDIESDYEQNDEDNEYVFA